MGKKITLENIDVTNSSNNFVVIENQTLFTKVEDLVFYGSDINPLLDEMSTKQRGRKMNIKEEG